MNSTQAVFLHSGYGATDDWLWSCLRDLDGVAVYNEPLRAMVESVDYAQYASPGSDRPLSTRPALDQRSVASAANTLMQDSLGLSRVEMAFSANQFEEATPEFAGDIEFFLRRLMGQAFDHGTIPVFRFSQSLGRLAWVRRAFPDVVHIVVARNPLAEWQLWCERFAARHDMHNFALLFLALACGRSVPAVERVVAGLCIDLPDAVPCVGERRTNHCIASLKAHAAYVGPAAAYRAFLGCWLLGMRYATTHADAIFDCDLAIRSQAYLGAAEAWIANLTGLTPSMQGARRNHTTRNRTMLFADDDAYLVAMEIGKVLVRDGSAPVDALALWASKLAEATLGARTTDEDATTAYGQMCVDQALRIVELAAAGSFGSDTVLASELAMVTAALSGFAEQVGGRRPRPWSRLTNSARSFFAARW